MIIYLQLVLCFSPLFLHTQSARREENTTLGTQNPSYFSILYTNSEWQTVLLENYQKKLFKLSFILDIFLIKPEHNEKNSVKAQC